MLSGGQWRQLVAIKLARGGSQQHVGQHPGPGPVHYYHLQQVTQGPAQVAQVSPRVGDSRGTAWWSEVRGQARQVPRLPDEAPQVAHEGLAQGEASPSLSASRHFRGLLLSGHPARPIDWVLRLWLIDYVIIQTMANRLPKNWQIIDCDSTDVYLRWTVCRRIFRANLEWGQSTYSL